MHYLCQTYINVDCNPSINGWGILYENTGTHTSIPMTLLALVFWSEVVELSNLDTTIQLILRKDCTNHSSWHKSNCTSISIFAMIDEDAFDSIFKFTVDLDNTLLQS